MGASEFVPETLANPANKKNAIKPRFHASKQRQQDGEKIKTNHLVCMSSQMLTYSAMPLANKKPSPIIGGLDIADSCRISYPVLWATKAIQLGFKKAAIGQ
jgi:hypothetical protein